MSCRLVFLSGPADAASTFTEFFDTQLGFDKTGMFVARQTNPAGVCVLVTVSESVRGLVSVLACESVLGVRSSIP